MRSLARVRWQGQQPGRRHDAVVDPTLQSMTGTYQIGNNRATWTFTRD